MSNRRPGCTQRELLQDIAHQAMIDRGLEPDFSPQAQQQLSTIKGPAQGGNGVKDMRSMLWCSIDNDDSRDLDQLSVADGDRVLVAVADVDAVVKRGTPIDEHARQNTTSVYTAAKIFPMLPEKLSTDLTSLNENQERVAIVVDMTVDDAGNVTKSDVYRALVHNKAKLTYNEVGAWLDGGAMPPKVAAVKGLAENLKIQDRAADRMRALRHERGALDLETIEARPVFQDGAIVDLQQERRNNARMVIEDLMIGANGVTAKFLLDHKLPSIRRVVRSPERWDRIEKIASDHGDKLPPDPDAKALEEFLMRQKKRDPLRFPDLSLMIVKAMGAGEYVVEMPGEEAIGHFGLAVRDYTHSTAPNRRFPDLIAHRLLKMALSGEPLPYSERDLDALAAHCTKQEDAANKVERQVRKSAAACLLSGHIGDRYDAIVTGASEKGVWVRIFKPPIEGKVVHGDKGLDIGERVRVKLVHTDIEQGHIDFVRS